MQLFIIKNDLDKRKITALLSFLKSWDIEAEFKSEPKDITKNKDAFSLSAGIWKDYAIDADGLRKKSWDRKL